jgi:non-ribosomal peptide synthetase component F
VQGAADTRAAAPAPQYGAYIEWLRHEDVGAAERFWHDALSGFCDAELFGGDSEAARFDARSCSTTATLEADDTRRIAGGARALKLTVNTIVCGAWAALLGRLLERDDVLFGVCVSGRTAAVPGVDEIVGPLMNVVPLRARVSGSTPVVGALRSLQSMSFGAQRYGYLSLPHIQAQSPIPRSRPLIETLVNFQSASSRDASSPYPEVQRLESRFWEANPYPLTLQVASGSRLALQLWWQPEVVDDRASRWLIDALPAVMRSLVAMPEGPLRALPVPSRPPVTIGQPLSPRATVSAD